MLDHMPDNLPGLVAALAIGFLIGLEREQRFSDGDEPPKGRRKAAPPAGVRTFALIALMGAVADILGPIPVAIAGGFVVIAAVAIYVRAPEADAGITTEVAMVVAFLLGVFAMEEAAYASAIGVVVAVLLASKSRLHDFAQRTLSAQEMHDLLLLAAAIAIVMPLLPDRALDPWNAFNPRDVWLLVIFVMAVNGVGYVALRAFGAKAGLAIAGLIGGFVSSTATTGAMGSRARQHPKLAGASAAAALMAGTASVIVLIAILAMTSTPLFRLLWLPLAATALASALAAGIAGWRAFRDPVPDPDALRGKAFKLSDALVFAAIMAGALLVSAAVREHFGQAWFTVAIAASGLANTNAAVGSVAQLVAADDIEATAGVWPILFAFTANSISKLIVAASTGGAAFVWRLAPGIVVANLVFAGVLLMNRIAAPATDAVAALTG